MEPQNNDVDKDSSRPHDSPEEPMITEQCIVEPDLPIFGKKFYNIIGFILYNSRRSKEFVI